MPRSEAIFYLGQLGLLILGMILGMILVGDGANYSDLRLENKCHVY